ncbi:MAG: nucleotidyltransferase family protein [Pseudoclavibacter sp.]
MTAAGASPDAATIAFSVSDGVALSTALTQHVAREQGIRMLVIKGPISADLGLRTRRYSTDVDIIVEPGRAHDLIGALSAYGWLPRPWPDFPKLLEQHSRTLIHESWPNDIDVHHYWPGFLGKPEEAFDRLWMHRIQVDVAGHPIDTPDRAGSALVLALHSLREEGQVSEDSRQMTEYVELIEALKKMEGTDSEYVSTTRTSTSLTEQILHDAVGTDSTQTARRFLIDLGHDVPFVPNATASEALRLWRLNSKAEHAMTGWMLKLQRAPLLQKPGIAARAFFPSRADLEAIDPELRNGAISLRKAWWRRVSRGLHGLVQARRDLRAFDKP